MKNTIKHWITIFLLSWLIKSTLTYFSFESYHKDDVLHDASLIDIWDKKEQKWISTSNRIKRSPPDFRMVEVEIKDTFIQHAYKVYFHFEVFLIVFGLITFGFWYFGLVNFQFIKKINSNKNNGINQLTKSAGFLVLLIWEAIHISLYFLAAERPANLKLQPRDLFFPYSYDSDFMNGTIFQINGVYDETELIVYTLLGLLIFLVINRSKLQAFQNRAASKEDENQSVLHEHITPTSNSTLSVNNRSQIIEPMKTNSKKYFLYDGKSKIGPLDFDDLKTKEIKRDSLIWFEGLDDWSQAGSLDEMRPIFELQPPPITINPNSELNDNKSNESKIIEDHSEKDAVKSLGSNNGEIRNTDYAQIEKYQGVDGWLLLFCIILTIISPLSTLYTILNSYQETHQFFNLYPGLKNIYYIDILLSGVLMTLSVRAGRALWNLKKGAVRTAESYLLIYLWYTLSAAALPFMAGLPSEFNEAMISPTVKDVLRGVLFFAVWSLYLHKSKRVKATYNLNPKSEDPDNI